MNNSIIFALFFFGATAIIGEIIFTHNGGIVYTYSDSLGIIITYISILFIGIVIGTQKKE